MKVTSRQSRLWTWLCSRGFAFAAYLMIAVAAISLYQERPPVTDVDFTISILGAIVSLTLVLAGLASAHAVVFGLKSCSVAMIKLEIPSLRILSLIIGLHGVIDMYKGAVPSGAIQFGLAMLLFHEMRALSVLRKGTHGGHI